MTENMTIGDFSIEQVAKALRASVLAYDKARERSIARSARSGEDRLRFRLISFAEIVKEPIKSKDEYAAIRIIKDPAQGAYRNAIRCIGEYIFKNTGSTDTMHDVLKLAAKRHHKRHYAILELVDKSWDGIGDWHA